MKGKRTHGIEEFYVTSGTVETNQWNEPIRISIIEKTDRIEIIYKETSMLSYTIHSAPEERVFKIIFSCKDGKWNKSERIYGEIISESEESYEFE